MAILQLRYNDDEILRKKSKEVRVIDDRVRLHLQDMMDTLHASESGAALAANQVGLLWRLVVVDYCGKCLKLVNPEIVYSEGQRKSIEGCLSFPNRLGTVIRPQKVTVKAFNENGEEIEITGEDDLAKCFCHEIDHLNGEVFIDKVVEFIHLDK